MTWVSSASRYSELSIYNWYNVIKITASDIQLMHNIQSDSKRWIQLNIKRRLNPRQTVHWSIPSSLLTLGGWLAWATLKSLLNLSHVLLWYTQNILCYIVTILLSTDAAAGYAIGEGSSGVIRKHRIFSFKCCADHSHTVHSSGNIDVRNWVHLCESRCIICR